MNREEIDQALAATEVMTGISIEGNNYRVSQFLALRHHLVQAVERVDELELEVTDLHCTIRHRRDGDGS